MPRLVILIRHDRHNHVPGLVLLLCHGRGPVLIHKICHGRGPGLVVLLHLVRITSDPSSGVFPTLDIDVDLQRPCNELI